MIPLYRAIDVERGELIVGHYVETVFTSEPMTVGDCRVHKLIIKDGDMFHIKEDTLEITFNNKHWQLVSELEDYNDLLHYKDITIGNFATDRPDLLNSESKEKYFWELKYGKN